MRRWQRIADLAYQRHTHGEAYAAVVLSGSYEEAGDHGRFRVNPGDVLLHERFDTHLNRFPPSGAVVLNLPLPAACAFEAGLGRVDDPDSVVRLAETRPAEAAQLLVSTIRPANDSLADWPDNLAAQLIANPSITLSDWGSRNGVAPWTLSRGFEQVFGIPPSGFRARARARLVWKAICATDEPFIEIAAGLGFADQAHMTRSVKRITGLAPKHWRRST